MRRERYMHTFLLKQINETHLLKHDNRNDRRREKRYVVSLYYKQLTHPLIKKRNDTRRKGICHSDYILVPRFLGIYAFYRRLLRGGAAIKMASAEASQKIFCRLIIHEGVVLYYRRWLSKRRQTYR